MKKWLRIVLKTLAVIFLLFGFILFFMTNTIDTTPYFETDYYKNTIAELDKQISNKKITEGQLLAGFSKVNITPKIKSGNVNSKKGEFNQIKLAGFSSGQFATSVHDSLFVKAIAIEVDKQMVILVSADLVIMPEAVVDKIVEILKQNKATISRQQLFFGVTHTHSSIGNCIPGFVGKITGGEYQPELIEWLSEKFVQVIMQAISDKKPAQIASGYIHVPNLISNRIIGETGRLNDKLTIVSIIQDEGKQAAIGVFAAHATSISTWNNQFSGDYPGYFQRSLESKGIDMAMFFAGTVGSHTNKGEGEKFSKAEFIGEALADSARVVIDKMEYTKTASLSSVVTEIEIPELQFVYLSNRLRLSSFIGKKLLPKMNSILLQGFQLNNLIWTAMPYELSGEYAIDLKNAMELQGYNSIFTSFNGQYLGYIIPAKYYYYDTYEARSMGWYGPVIGDYLMELNYKLANSLTNSKL